MSALAEHPIANQQPGRSFAPAAGSAISEARRQAEPYAVEWQGTRRDTCFAVGETMLELNQRQAAEAWRSLGRSLVRLGDKDIPKFMDMLASINAATMVGSLVNNRPNGLGAAGAQMQGSDLDTAIRPLSQNAAAQWRAANDAPYATETQSARPLQQYCWAIGLTLALTFLAPSVTGEGHGTIQSLVTTTSNGIWVKYLGMNLTGMSFCTISPLPCHTLHLYRKPARAQKHLTRHLPGKDGGRKTSTLLSALLPAKKDGRDTVTIPPLPGLSSFTEEPYPVLNVAGGSCTSTEADTKQIAPAFPVFVTENIARFAPTSFVHPINEIARRGLAFWAVHP